MHTDVPGPRKTVSVQRPRGVIGQRHGLGHPLGFCTAGKTLAECRSACRVRVVIVLERNWPSQSRQDTIHILHNYITIITRRNQLQSSCPRHPRSPLFLSRSMRTRAHRLGVINIVGTRAASACGARVLARPKIDFPQSCGTHAPRFADSPKPYAYRTCNITIHVLYTSLTIRHVMIFGANGEN